MSLKFSKSDFEKALENAYSIHPRTLLSDSERLTEQYGVEILLKLENTQPIGSYKWRGAGQKISSLDSGIGVVTASAGNHAQGVALACKTKGVKGIIYMPETTPLIKVRKTREIGGDAVDVILHGDNFDEAFGAAKGKENSDNLTFVHPFDDEQTILGQSTVGVEIIDQMKEVNKTPSLIMVPNGGGGLTSGVQLAMNTYSPETRVIGVEPESAASMSTSLSNGEITLVKTASTIADGAKVGRVGELCFEVCRDNNVQILTSPEGRLCSTVLEMHSDWRTLEGAGALGVDGLKSLDEQTLESVRKNKGSIVVILSGGNIDTDAYQIITEKSLRYEGLKRDYLIKFPEKAGAFKKFVSLFPPGFSVSRFYYDKNHSKAKNDVTVSIESLESSDFGEIEEQMQQAGFDFRDITSMDYEG